MADLRDSGSLEQDADIVTFMYRPDYYDPMTPHAGLADLRVLKHRNGRTGTVGLGLSGATTSFRDLES